MSGKKKIVRPRYQQIAVDLAERIVENRYKVGEKIHARSTLASTYNASPETTRKAINVLVDLGIMEVRHGSGAFVASKEKQRFPIAISRCTIHPRYKKAEIMASVEKQQDELNHFSQLLDQLVNQTKRIHKMNPLLPFELSLSEKAMHLDRSISELNIWQATGATVIAISHNEELLVSPGPYAKFTAGDIVHFIEMNIRYSV